MPRILVVDDEKSIRVTVRAFLQEAGYEVDIAENAEQAQALLANGAWDVVVTDIVLPGISGVELLRSIRAASPGVEVIMMTGDPTVETAAEAVRAGASDYLTKPAMKNAIIRSVATAARMKALDEARRREQEAKERHQQELQVAVTKLTAANEQLRRAGEFREEVEQLTRHDLKSPLFIILNAPGLIQTMGGSLTEGQLDWLGKIRSAGQRMLEMVNRSLDIFKIEQGIYTLQPEAVDILGVAREVISHSEALIRIRKLSVVILVDDHPAADDDAVMVSGEKLLLYSMVGNLLKNACEASPNGESVTLRFERGDTLRMSIRNRGAVPGDMRDRFFEKFSTSGKRGGTGLGTYSARLIAEIHGAQIAVDTADPAFTTVTVCFPLNVGTARKSP